MNKDLLEEYQNDECVKSCEECVNCHFCRLNGNDNEGVCYDFERWVKDEKL